MQLEYHKDTRLYAYLSGYMYEYRLFVWNRVSGFRMRRKGVGCKVFWWCCNYWPPIISNWNLCASTVDFTALYQFSRVKFWQPEVSMVYCVINKLIHKLWFCCCYRHFWCIAVNFPNKTENSSWRNIISVSWDYTIITKGLTVVDIGYA